MFLIFFCLIAYIFWPSQLRQGKKFSCKQYRAGKKLLHGETPNPQSSRGRMEANGIQCIEREIIQLFSFQIWTLH